MSWQLSAAQWDVLTELLHIESYPAPIQVQVHGRTDVERGRIRAQVVDELSRLGLLQGGRVEPDLEAALTLLRRPASWVDSVWLPGPEAEQPVRVVAAREAGTGVCARQHPDRPGETLLEAIPATGLAAAVVGKLPPHPPGKSPAVSLAPPPSAAQRSQPDGGLMVSASTAQTSAERDRSAAAAILERPHSRAGQIAANVRDPSGRVRRSEVLRWCDNPDGRYQVTLRHQPDGAQWLTVTPADPRRLGDAVQQLLAVLHPHEHG